MHQNKLGRQFDRNQYYRLTSQLQRALHIHLVIEQKVANPGSATSWCELPCLTLYHRYHREGLFHPYQTTIEEYTGTWLLLGYSHCPLLDERRIGVRIPVRSRIFTSVCRPDQLWGPPSLLSSWYRGPFQRG
jgi:hypothetical protein